MQPDGLKRFAAALSEAAVEVGGPSALAFDRQADELEYVILLPYCVHEHPVVMTEGLRQAILRQLGETDITAPTTLSMRAQKLDPASPELAKLDAANVEQPPLARTPGRPLLAALGAVLAEAPITLSAVFPDLPIPALVACHVGVGLLLAALAWRRRRTPTPPFSCCSRSRRPGPVRSARWECWPR